MKCAQCKASVSLRKWWGRCPYCGYNLRNEAISILMLVFFAAAFYVALDSLN